MYDQTDENGVIFQGNDPVTLRDADVTAAIIASFTGNGWQASEVNRTGPLREFEVTKGTYSEKFLVYIWKVGNGGATRSNSEKRIQISSAVNGQLVRDPNKKTLLLGYYHHNSHFCFVAWDAHHHQNPRPSESCQVNIQTIASAYLHGLGFQQKPGEIVCAFRANCFPIYLQYMNIFHRDQNFVASVTQTPKIQPTTPVTGGTNVIVHGAPGTGKSRFIDDLVRGKWHIRTTFHTDYSYEDFVGVYKPVSLYKNIIDNSVVYDKPQNLDNYEPIIDYTFVPGPFLTALVHAYNNPTIECYLIVEEINRANASAAFGNIFQLLDRLPSGESEYPIVPDAEVLKYINSQLSNTGPFTDLLLPPNLWIYATMNVADQGVQPLDTAFKRRWDMLYLPVDFSNAPHSDEEVSIQGIRIKWRELVTKLNSVMANLDIPQDRHIGPFFLKQGEPSNQDKVRSKLLFYLWEDALRHKRNRVFVQNIKTFDQLLQAYNSGDRIFNFDLLPQTTVSQQAQQSQQDIQPANNGDDVGSGRGTADRGNGNDETSEN